MKEINLIGGFYKSKTLPWSAQDVVNWAPVPSRSGGTRSPLKLRGLPGLKAVETTTPPPPPPCVLAWDGPFSFSTGGFQAGTAIWHEQTARFITAIGPGTKYSEDFGQTYTTLNGATNYFNLATNPATGRVIRISSAGAVGASDDGGTSWSSVASVSASTATLRFDDGRFWCFVAPRANAGGANGEAWTSGATNLFDLLGTNPSFTAYDQGAGLYLLAVKDSGVNAGKVAGASTPTSTFTLRGQVALNPGEAFNGIYYSAVAGKLFGWSSSGRVFESTDAGQNWTVNTVFSTGYSIEQMIDLTGEGRILLNGFGVIDSTLISSDGGATWVPTYLPSELSDAGLSSWRALAWSQSAETMIAVGATNVYRLRCT